ncbi:MAG: DinB family protein [Chloroflexota bacterium]|nr:DinB family protein [Chloroflexota bacterium]
MAIRVVLEVAAKRSFASALDWPGWARSGKSPDEALERLAGYADRYAVVAKRAHVRFRGSIGIGDLEISQRVRGGSGTEFGVPGVAASAESEAPSAAELTRAISLLEAAWDVFDEVAAAAEGTQLRLGPRGGGRQVGKMVGHVQEAEAAYLHQLGWKVPNPRPSAAEVRRSFVAAVRLRAAGKPLPEPNRVHTPWEPRYAIRRAAWHTLDHAWEIEDRSV